MSAPPSLADLRRLLAARFPSSPRRVAEVVPTGIASLDEAAEGGLPAGAITEFVCPSASGGGGLALFSLLLNTRAARQRVALLDASDSFAPDELPPDLLEHLVWARAGGTASSGTAASGAGLKNVWAAADLLVRDSHFAVVALDLREIPERDLLRVPGSTWYRLQRALEQSRVAALVLASTACVPCATHRFVFEHDLPAAALDAERGTLTGHLCPRHERQRAGRIHSSLSA